MNIITPLILIIISIGTFITYINPNYRGTDPLKPSIQVLQKEHDEYQKALADSFSVNEIRNNLSTKKQNFDKLKMERLEDLLPDNIDNIKLVIDIKNIAQNPMNGNLVLKNIKLNNTTGTDPKKIGSDNSKYGTVGLSFSVTSSYDNFNNFLKDLEKSLRLVDITDLSVTGSDTGLYDFSVTLKTYWLK